MALYEMCIGEHLHYVIDHALHLLQGEANAIAAGVGSLFHRAMAHWSLRLHSVLDIFYKVIYWPALWYSSGSSGLGHWVGILEGCKQYWWWQNE